MSESAIPDNLQPTFVYEPDTDAENAGESSVDVSRAQVGVAGGQKPRFADETASLLRQRLQAAALILSVVLIAAFVGSLAAGDVPLAALRVVVVIVFVTSFLVLRSRLPLSLPQLRLAELVIFGTLGAQLLLMMCARVSGFARAGDATSAVAAEHVFVSVWAIVILTYGIFMPNPWQRAAAVLLPAACVPYLVVWLLHWRVPEVAAAFEADHLQVPVPMPFVAVLVAVYGAHIIHAVRREAFKARQFGQYRLKEKLGAGGMGEVYKAEHQLLKRPCAIKLIKANDETNSTALARFELEVQATSQLSHWNTVEIYDYGHTEDGTFYYVMELLPGMSLEDLVRNDGPLPAGRAVHFLRQTCCALSEAHAIGLIHRDLKPANIFAAQRGGVFDVAKLLDFGLVKQQAAGVGESHLTQQGGFSGSPLYMSPEQATAYSDVDQRSDIYSLGAIAYYLLTGRPPFSGANPLQVIVAHSRDPVVPPSQLNAEVTKDLEAIVLQCLAKAPADRFQHVDDVRRALEACACYGAWTEDIAADWWAKANL